MKAKILFLAAIFFIVTTVSPRNVYAACQSVKTEQAETEKSTKQDDRKLKRRQNKEMRDSLKEAKREVRDSLKEEKRGEKEKQKEEKKQGRLENDVEEQAQREENRPDSLENRDGGNAQGVKIDQHKQENAENVVEEEEREDLQDHDEELLFETETQVDTTIVGSQHDIPIESKQPKDTQLSGEIGDGPAIVLFFLVIGWLLIWLIRNRRKFLHR